MKTLALAALGAMILGTAFLAPVPADAAVVAPVGVAAPAGIAAPAFECRIHRHHHVYRHVLRRGISVRVHSRTRAHVRL